eukprot:8325193-Alexandrium_andersonii.AAC.1
MSASLVGSEMCIRDSSRLAQLHARAHAQMCRRRCKHKYRYGSGLATDMDEGRCVGIGTRMGVGS